MSEHRPYAILQVDVFLDELSIDDEPQDLQAGAVARAAWSDINDWVTARYLPVLTVRLPDGSEHEVDLEEVWGDA